MINIKNLDFSYSAIKLFNQLNLELSEGKIYGLLGKNGAGKTSLLKIITGLIFPKSGNCSVLDFESRMRIPDMLKEIFFIPETYFLPDTTIEKYENQISPFYERFDRDFFYTVIKEMDLERTHNLKALSYGQKKKFLFAFGLASRCKIMIFDEPTNGLDIPSQKQIRKQLSGYMIEGRTMIISTHHVKEMENIFDVIVLLDNGKIIFNRDLSAVNEKLAVKTVSSLTDEPDILYSEEIPGGYSVLLKNNAGIDTKMDIEFLFNAIIADQEKINTIFN